MYTEIEKLHNCLLLTKYFNKPKHSVYTAYADEQLNNDQFKRGDYYTNLLRLQL